MQGTVKMITAAQLRNIYGIGKRHDLDNDWIHYCAETLFGKESLKELTCREAAQMIGPEAAAAFPSGTFRRG